MTPTPAPQTIRARAIVLGLAFSMLICALTPFNNIYRQATPLGGGYFPLAPFFLLMLTVLLVAVLKKFNRGMLGFNGPELLLMWIMTVLVSGIAYTGLARTFFINLTAPFHFATAGNRWQEVLQPVLPHGLFPMDAGAIKLLYNGFDAGRQMGWLQILAQIPWLAWVGPLAAWSLFILLCYGVMICIVTIFSRQWIHHERMNFPLLRVPELMVEALETNQSRAFWTNRFLLIGMLIPICLHLLNGLNFYLPSIPQIPTLILAGPYFPKYGLFSGFHKLKIYFYPAFIGFAFLTARQISFSFWFFYLLGGLLFGLLALVGYAIPPAALGITFGPTLAHPEETQMIGAFGIFFLFIVWLARQHLWQVAAGAFGRAAPVDNHFQWFSTRLAFWGMMIGVAGILLWCGWFGMNMGVALLVVGAFFMVMLVSTRIICQGGIAYFTLTAAPTDGLLAMLGPRFFTPAVLALSAIAQKVLFVDLRESLMPSLMHAAKVTQNRPERRRILGAIIAALILGVLTSFAAMLALCHKFGARELGLDWATRTTIAVYDNIFTLIDTPLNCGHWVPIFIVIGAIVMLALIICYHRFYWWPLHPIGYLTAYSSAMRILWVSFFIGWLANAMCMRYGGVTMFRRLRMLFVGLIIGDFLMGAIWALIGLFADGSYQVFPT